MAMAQLTNQLIYLEEGDWAIIRPEGYEIFDENDTPVSREITTIKGGPTVAALCLIIWTINAPVRLTEPTYPLRWIFQNLTGLS
jgi:hypothetical protein